jgi:hypothetical protein
MFIPACGYRFTTGGGHLPTGDKTVAIPVVDNRTPEVAANIALTNALRDSAFRAGLDVEADGPQLQGTILSITAVPRGVVILDGQFRSREQEIIVEVRLKLFETQQQPPWERTLVERVSYLSGPDLRDSEANRLLALRTALRRLADRGIDALTREF